MTNMAIPSKKQLVDGDGLDERYVIEHFLGKSVEDAYRIFADGGGYITEDISYMSIFALDYYLPAALKYLQSSDSVNDWEFASGVLTSVSCVCNRCDLTESLRRTMSSIVEYISLHLDKYDATNDDWVQSRIEAVRHGLNNRGRV
ncbi:hypothetical protein [Novipirellula caenicola]|uniref:Uncharacterized protein n=1 Tax=Novipirellula caenicola TaxID=1536901 RepID=A0ABP9VUS2_9BACT